MTDDDYGANVYTWVGVARAARLGKTVKLVALVLASHADPDGTRVFPGVALTSVESEVSYNVVKAALGKLRDVGMLELVRYGSRRDKKTDEYRLILHPDVMERIEVWTPAKIRLEVEKIQTQRRGKHRAPDPDEVLQPTTEAAETASVPLLQPTSRAAETALQPTGKAAKEDASESFAAHAVVPNTGFAAHFMDVLQPTQCPPTNHVPEHVTPTDHTAAEVLTNLTVSRTSGPEDHEIDPLPGKCSHGLTARKRPDGTVSCALCRISARLSPFPKGATA